MTAAERTSKVEETAACEVGRHHLCRGTIVSLTAAHGTRCGCGCHEGDDLAVTAAIERDHLTEDGPTAQDGLPAGLEDHPSRSLARMGCPAAGIAVLPKREREAVRDARDIAKRTRDLLTHR